MDVGSAECAEVFHVAGARLILCGRDEARLQKVAQELTAKAADSPRQVTLTHPGHVTLTHPGQVTLTHPRQVTLTHPGQVTLTHPGQVTLILQAF